MERRVCVPQWVRECVCVSIASARAAVRSRRIIVCAATAGAARLPARPTAATSGRAAPPAPRCATLTRRW